jgi:hypothetical protein
MRLHQARRSRHDSWGRGESATTDSATKWPDASKPIAKSSEVSARSGYSAHTGVRPIHIAQASLRFERRRCACELTIQRDRCQASRGQELSIDLPPT